MKKSFAAAVEINSALIKLEDFVCLVSEPYVSKGKISSKPPESLVVSEGASPRAAIFASRKLNVIKLGNLSNRDCAVGLIKSKKEKFIIASVYMDINKEMVPEWLEKLVTYASKKKIPIIIGCLLYTSPSPRD